MIRRLAAVAVACALASPAWGGVKEDKHQQMIGIAQQMRELRASGSSSSAQYAALESQYAQLSAALGGDDPAATLPDGSSAVDGRSPSAPVGSMGEIPPPPPGCISQVQQFSNNTPVPISSAGTPLVTSTQVVAGAGAYLWDLDLRTFITHTFAADLDVTIQSPAGTVVTLTTDNRSSNDNVFNGTLWDDDSNPGSQVPCTSNQGQVSEHTYVNLTLASPLLGEEALAAFTGEDPNGVWTITISDDALNDGGTLNGWSIEVQTATCLAACELTCPDNVTASNDANQCGAIVNYPAPVVSDNCPGIGVPVCTPPSGSTFNLGATRATCTVLDAAGNSAGAGFSVTVFDDEPPALTCPADVFAAAPPGALSWPVSFPTPTPTDNCPGVAAACDPASGDSFPVGTTTDVCTATDGAGLTATCDFDVTVAEQAIQEIPTASTLGLAALALLLAGAAFVGLHRHG